jgi:hypothetical protein
MGISNSVGRKQLELFGNNIRHLGRAAAQRRPLPPHMANAPPPPAASLNDRQHRVAKNQHVTQLRELSCKSMRNIVALINQLRTDHKNAANSAT